VSLEFRKGTNLALLSKASITSPNADKLLLMCCASLSCCPAASLCFTRSDPARSTRCSFATVASEAPSSLVATSITITM
jgi:hypothetical protein